MNGTHGRFDCVRMGNFTRLSLTSDRPLHIHADGEIFTSFGYNLRKLSVEVLPGCVECFVGLILRFKWKKIRRSAYSF